MISLYEVRETMKKNKLEEEEAEEEMDELHHENEELHQQLEKVQKENSEMKSKLMSMSEDSEKLGGLKVSIFRSLFGINICTLPLPTQKLFVKDGAPNAGGGTK